MIASMKLITSKRNPKKKIINLPDFRNVERGKAELAAIIKASEEKDKKK